MSEPRKDAGVTDATSNSHSRPITPEPQNNPVPRPPLIAKHSLSRADIERILKEGQNSSVASRSDRLPQVAVTAPDKAISSSPVKEKGAEAKEGDDFIVELGDLPPEVRESVRSTIAKNQGRMPIGNSGAKITIIEEGKPDGQDPEVEVIDKQSGIEVVVEPPVHSKPQPNAIPSETGISNHHSPHSSATLNREEARPSPSASGQRSVSPAGKSVRVIAGRATINLVAKTPEQTGKEDAQNRRLKSGGEGKAGLRPTQSLRTGPVKIASSNGQTLVYFSGASRQPAAINVDETANKVTVGPATPEAVKKAEEKLAKKRVFPRAAQEGYGAEGSQPTVPSAEDKPHPASPSVITDQSPKIAPDQAPKKSREGSDDTASEARIEAAALEMIPDTVSDVGTAPHASNSGDIVPSSQRKGKSVQTRYKGSAKRERYKKPPIITKPVIIMGVAAAALCGMVWFSNNHHSDVYAPGGRHASSSPMPLPDDADSLPQPDAPVKKQKGADVRQPALPKMMPGRPPLPPPPTPNEEIWKITPKPSSRPTVSPPLKPQPSQVAVPSPTPEQADSRADALPAGMVPASVVASRPAQTGKVEDLRSITVGGVKMYVPSDSSTGNLDTLGIDTDYAQAARLSEAKGGCEAVSQQAP